MSDFDVFPDDMRSIDTADGLAFERLLSGRLDAPALELEEEAAFLARMSRAVPEPSVDHLETAHLAAMMEAATEITVAPAPAPQSQRSTRVGFLAGLRMRAAAAGATLLTAFGGMAYAGILPEPIQERVASAADAIGINLPRGGVAHADEERSGGRGKKGDADEPRRASASVVGHQQGDSPDGSHRGNEQDDSRPAASDDSEDDADDAPDGLSGGRQKSSGGTAGNDEAEDDEDEGTSDDSDDSDDADEEAADSAEDEREEQDELEEEEADDALDAEEDAVDEREDAVDDD